MGDARKLRALKSALVFALVAGIPLLVLAIHASRYYPFIADDSLISLRYADRLLQGDGLTWSNGVRVEGYSNLLWVLFCALLGLLGVDLIDATRILGFAGMGAAILAIASLYRPKRLYDALPALAGGLGVALSGPAAVWTVGGLEPPLLVGLIAWASVLSLKLLEHEAASPREVVWPGILFGLACLTRPDSPIFVAVTAGAILALGRFDRSAWKKASLLVAIPLVFVVAQEIFRLVYYNDFIPNSAHAKLAFSYARARGGLTYLGGGLLPLAGLLIPAVASVVAAARISALRVRVAFFAAPLIAWSAYVVVIGGDIFPGRRHLVVVVLFLSLLSAEFWAFIRNRAVAGIAVTASILLLGWGQWSGDPEHQRAIEERWEWDGEIIGNLLKQAFGPQEPLLAVDAAGCLPYFSGLPSLDMLGLNDRFLAHHPPPNFGKGPLGHELGNGQYVLRRKPDLVIFCLPQGSARPCFRSEGEMFLAPEFHRQYMLVPFLGTEPRGAQSLIWVRTESASIGIQRSDDRIVVPGYLLQTGFGGKALLDSEGRIGLHVPRRAKATLKDFSLTPGDWRLQLEASGAPTIDLWQSGNDTPLLSGTDARVFTLPNNGRKAIDLQLTGEAHIREIVFHRVPLQSEMEN